VDAHRPYTVVVSSLTYSSWNARRLHMIVPRIALLVAALLLTAPVDLFAQRGAPVSLGDRVRVTVPTEVSGRIVGTLMQMGADTLVLAVKGRAEPLALPLASVTKFEVVRSQQNEVHRGALIGLFGGAALGGLIGAATTAKGNENLISPRLFNEPCSLETTGCRVLRGVVVGAGVGLLVGAAVGLAVKTYQWEEVSIGGLRVTPFSFRHGDFTLTFSLRF
jgi:hypothetical protein